MRKAHSNGMPRRSDMARIDSTLPSGSVPVSCSRRPTSVDLPWSTWPTMTILSWWASRVIGRVPGVVERGSGTWGSGGSGSGLAGRSAARPVDNLDLVGGQAVDRRRVIFEAGLVGEVD